LRQRCDIAINRIVRPMRDGCGGGAIEVGQFPPPNGSRYNNSALKTF
jgi:hypothetical protein